MFRLASSPVSKVRLVDKRIRLVTAYNYCKQRVVNHAFDARDDWDQITDYKYMPVLAQALYGEGMKLLIGGADVSHLVEGIHKAQNVIVEHLTRRARKISSSEEIVQVATVAANGDRKIGELILKAMEKVESEDLIFISETKNSTCELKFDKGMKLDWGLVSTFYSTNKKLTFILRNPLILIVDRSDHLSSFIRALFKEFMKFKRPLVVVVNDIDIEDAGDLHIQKHYFGPKVKLAVIKSVKPGENSKLIMQDLAILTGARIVTKEYGFGDPAKMLGSCKKPFPFFQVMASYDKTIIVGGSGKQAGIENRCEQLRFAIKSSTSVYEVKLLKERLAKLSGAAAVIKVGGASKAEVLEKRRVNNTLAAVKAAMEGGILPGGGTAMLHVSKELDKLEVTNSGQKLGVRLLQHVLEMPVYSIASATGIDNLVVDKLIEQDNPDLGYDPARGEYVDMMKAGYVDPLKLILTKLGDLISGFDNNIWAMHKTYNLTKLIGSSNNGRREHHTR